MRNTHQKRSQMLSSGVVALSLAHGVTPFVLAKIRLIADGRQYHQYLFRSAWKPINMATGLDVYEWKARMLPILLSLLPMVITAIALFGEGTNIVKGLIPIPFYAAACYAFLSFVRDRSKISQNRMFSKWGGSPTTIRMRHKGNDPTRISELHRKLEVLCQICLPNKQEEQSDPVGSDRKYDRCIEILREKTRDLQRFRLLFAENIHYGFRRHTLYLKPVAILLALLATVLFAILCYQSKFMVVSFDVALLTNLCHLAFFCLAVNENWLKTQGFAYADRLLASIDQF
jgi:hypothetical protein